MDDIEAFVELSEFVGVEASPVGFKVRNVNDCLKGSILYFLLNLNLARRNLVDKCKLANDKFGNVIFRKGFRSSGH